MRNTGVCVAFTAANIGLVSIVQIDQCSYHLKQCACNMSVWMTLSCCV